MYSFDPSLKNTLGLYVFKSLRQEKKFNLKKLSSTLIISLGLFFSSVAINVNVPKLIQISFQTMAQKFVQRCETKVDADACKAS